MARTFIQVERSSMTAHRELIKKSPAAAQILDFVWQTMDEQNCLVASQRTVAELTGISQATVSRAFKILEADRWVQRVTVGLQSVIVANAGVVWSQARNKKHYAFFKGLVLASADEQREGIAALNNVRLRRMPSHKDVGHLAILNDEDPPSQEDLEY